MCSVELEVSSLVQVPHLADQLGRLHPGPGPVPGHPGHPPPGQQQVFTVIFLVVFIFLADTVYRQVAPWLLHTSWVISTAVYRSARLQYLQLTALKEFRHQSVKILKKKEGDKTDTFRNLGPTTSLCDCIMYFSLALTVTALYWTILYKYEDPPSYVNLFVHLFQVCHDL